MNRSRLLPVLVLVVISASIVGVAPAQEEFAVASGEYLEVRIQGDGAVEQTSETVYVWASEPPTIAVGPTPAKADRHFIYCIDVDGSEVWCEQGTLSSGETFAYRSETGTLSPGRHQVRARIHVDDVGYDNPQKEALTFTMHVIRKDGDIDDDGASNRQEVTRGLELRNSDSDGDGLQDGRELQQSGTDPLAADSDRDGLDDEAEVTRYNTDPTSEDTDGDGLADGDEVERGTEPLSAHTDGDGVNDGTEVHEQGTNPAQTDTDGDGLGDGAERDRGSDPTDSGSPGSDTDGNREQSEQQTPPSQAEDRTQAAAVGGERSGDSDSSVHRGFLTNDPDSSLAVLNNPFNLTTLGFLLSIVGILFDLRRGG